MDRVRFGRALGFGARQAMKTLWTAADAAASPNPSSARPQPGAQTSQPRPASAAATSGSAATSSPTARAAQAATRTVSKAQQAHRGVTRGTQRFGQAVWNPFVRLSGVLWLEVTGVFFGILALFAAQGAWKARSELHPGPGGHQHLLGAAGMLAVFGYFCVSSFLRAHRRQHGR